MCFVIFLIFVTAASANNVNALKLINSERNEVPNRSKNDFSGPNKDTTGYSYIPELKGKYFEQSDDSFPGYVTTREMKVIGSDNPADNRQINEYKREKHRKGPVYQARKLPLFPNKKEPQQNNKFGQHLVKTSYTKPTKKVIDLDGVIKWIINNLQKRIYSVLYDNLSQYFLDVAQQDNQDLHTSAADFGNQKLEDLLKHYTPRQHAQSQKNVPDVQYYLVDPNKYYNNIHKVLRNEEQEPVKEDLYEYEQIKPYLNLFDQREKKDRPRNKVITFPYDKLYGKMSNEERNQRTLLNEGLVVNKNIESDKNDQRQIVRFSLDEPTKYRITGKNSETKKFVIPNTIVKKKKNNQSIKRISNDVEKNNNNELLDFDGLKEKNIDDEDVFIVKIVKHKTRNRNDVYDKVINRINSYIHNLESPQFDGMILADLQLAMD